MTGWKKPCSAREEILRGPPPHACRDWRPPARRRRPPYPVRDDHGSALVALAHQCEQNLGLLGALLDVAQVVEDQDLEVIELAKSSRQIEVALGYEQILDDGEGRHEEHGTSRLDERVPEGGTGVALACAGQAEREDIDRLVHEVAATKILDLAGERRGQSFLVERIEGLLDDRVQQGPELVVGGCHEVRVHARGVDELHIGRIGRIGEPMNLQVLSPNRLRAWSSRR